MGEELSIHFADKAMFNAEPIKDELPKVYLIQATADPLGSLAAASMMYEGKVCRNLNSVSDDQRRHYWAESFKTHLKAPWEFMDFHFMIESVTRAWTHQAVRQRTAVYAQESMRFAVKDSLLDGAVRAGPNITGNPVAESEYWSAIEAVQDAYHRLIELGIPAEDARGLLPHDTLTRMNYKTNLRNLAEHLGNRLCTQAQFEWRLVAASLRQAIRDYIPLDQTNYWQFQLIAESPIFQPVCFTVGKCPFKADFDRGCTIRKRVDEGKFDEIEPHEWLADPTAGWVR